MNYSGIYSITHIVSGKRYIGSSVNILRRWNAHRSALNRHICDNPHLQNSWDKYGPDSFEFEILENNIDPVLLENKENEYIIKFGIGTPGSNKFNESIGFNTQWAGRTGCVDPNKYINGESHHLYGTTSPKKNRTFEEMYGIEKSDELKSKISSATKQRDSGMKGKLQTTEARQKMSTSKKNKPWTAARRAAQDNKRNT